MAATALIQFVQGITVGSGGQVLVGSTGTPVTVQNSNNTGIQSWQIDLVYTPSGSSVPVSIPLAFSNNGAVPSAVFTPDVSGSYRFVMKVWATTGRPGVPTDTDIRNFVVPEPNGIVVPPYQKDPDPLPTLASAKPGAKPNEMNINGEELGWTGTGSDGLLAEALKTLDAATAPSLSTVLGVGNTTGAHDVIVNDGRFIQFGSTLPATAGDIRLRNDRSIYWFQSTTDSNIGLTLDSNDDFIIGDTDNEFPNSVIAQSFQGFIVKANGATVATIGLFGPLGTLLFDPALDGVLILPDTPTTSIPGVSIAMIGGEGGTGAQDGGDSYIQAGAATDSGTPGSSGVKDSFGNWVVQLDGAGEMFYDAFSTHTFKVAGAQFLQAGLLGNVVVLGAVGDAGPDGFLITASPPTTASPGIDVGISGGEGGAVGNQPGGDAIVRAGGPSGTGADGWAGIQDAEAGWRLYLDQDRNFFYDAEASHAFAFGGTVFGTIAAFGGFLAIGSDTDGAPDGMLISPLPPVAALPGGAMFISGGFAGGTNENGGDVAMIQGLATGTGTHGSAGIWYSDQSWLFRADPEGFFELTDALSAPPTPTGAYAIWSDTGALKGKGTSGTITTIGPADPHCPRCGNDFVHEWVNPRRGRKLSICVWCLTEGFTPAECVIEKE
jgi:hypothetical protein